MKLDSLSLFRFASDRMQWLSARQKTISENIANANTPGYRAKDVSSFQSYVDSVNQAQQDGQNAAPFGTDVPVSTVDAPDSWSTTISGNTVVLEQQTVKASQTAAQYQLAANLYRKASDLLTTAVTGQ
ncbi:flagellar basal body rod protein FlgB [Solirhodobacter olei]|uniref:flagellar basal body rod protein FlgB n=1 Tax=Solirhodobacter olei TaxID=2493082 RepID=UPI000FD6BA47|nr:flagellar basal body protein [Solirhodobacter olei]